MSDTPQTTYVFVQRTFFASVKKRDEAVKASFDNALGALLASDHPLSTRADVFHDDQKTHRTSLPVLCAEFIDAKSASAFQTLLKDALEWHVSAHVFDTLPPMGSTPNLGARQIA